MKVSSMLNNWLEVRFDRCLQEFCDIKFFCSLDLKSQWKCIHWIDKHWQLRKQHQNQKQTQLQQCLLLLLLLLNLAERGFWRIEIRDHAVVCMHGWCDMFYTQQLGLGVADALQPVTGHLFHIWIFLSLLTPLTFSQLCAPHL